MPATFQQPVTAEPEHTDRRIRKSKAAIHQALMALMKQKKISQISVRELTELADVNRKTFYNHYNDIYAVLGEMEDECVDRLIGLINTDEIGDINRYVGQPAEFFTRLITEIHENEEFYTLLVQSQSHSHITQKLIGREKELLRKLIGPSQVNEVWLDCFLSFICAGMSSVLNTWFTSDKQVPIESLAAFFSTLFNGQDIRRFISAMRSPSL